MRRLLRWYGANPLHLLAFVACFALAGYAAVRLVSPRPLAVAVWVIGAVVGHDLLLVPLYSLADRSAMAAIRHRAPLLPAVPWINYLRVPAGLSALLFLVWFPLILRLRTHYRASTRLSPDPFLWHWLAVTGALFLLSAAAFAVRLRTARRRVGPPPPPPPPPSETPRPLLPQHGGGHDDDGDRAAHAPQSDPATHAQESVPTDQEQHADTAEPGEGRQARQAGGPGVADPLPPPSTKPERSS